MPPLFERPLSGGGDDDCLRACRRKRQNEQPQHRSRETLCETTRIHRSINDEQALFFNASLPEETGSQRRVCFVGGRLPSGLRQAGPG
jgi:hypothetical protein